VLTARERAEAGDVLARLGDPRFDPEAFYLPRLFRGEPEPLLGFVEVPAGPFVMGEGEEAYEVNIPYPYYIARYPVTVAQFRAFVEDGGYAEERYWPEGRAAGVWRNGKIKGFLDDEPRDRPVDFREPFNFPNHPVVGVSWYEALAYCRWLTEKLRGWEGTPEPLRTLLREKGYVVRLPTEAEWEKAARGGLILSDGRRNPSPEREWPWEGDFDPERANTVETRIRHTTAVGCFPGGASPCRVLDMAGNVWEWCQSLLADYPYGPDDGREDLEAKGGRILRGGSWVYNRESARCAYRYGNLPDYRNVNVGFRVVVSPGP